MDEHVPIGGVVPEIGRRGRAKPGCLGVSNGRCGGLVWVEWIARLTRGLVIFIRSVKFNPSFSSIHSTSTHPTGRVWVCPTGGLEGVVSIQQKTSPPP